MSSPIGPEILLRFGLVDPQRGRTMPRDERRIDMVGEPGKNLEAVTVQLPPPKV